MNGEHEILDDLHAWCEGQLFADFQTVAKGMSVQELGRWRQTLPMLAVKIDSVTDSFVGLPMGGSGMRRLTVAVVFDVIDTTEYECLRLGAAVREALRADPDWGLSVDTSSVDIDCDWDEPFDRSNADDPLPFLVWRIRARGLTFGV